MLEVKPNSFAAITKGREQARNVRDLLNKPATFKRAVEDESKPAACDGKKFRARVDCYIYCPDVDDQGEIRSASMDWSTCDQD